MLDFIIRFVYYFLKYVLFMYALMIIALIVVGIGSLFF